MVDNTEEDNGIPNTEKKYAELMEQIDMKQRYKEDLAERIKDHRDALELPTEPYIDDTDYIPEYIQLKKLIGEIVIDAQNKLKKETAKIQNLLNNYETKVTENFATEFNTSAASYKRTADVWLHYTIMLIILAIGGYSVLMFSNNITSNIQNFYFILPVSLLTTYLIFMFSNKHYKNNALSVEYKDLYTKIQSAKQVGNHLGINADDMSYLAKQYLKPIKVSKNNKALTLKTLTLKELNELLENLNNIKNLINTKP